MVYHPVENVEANASNPTYAQGMTGKLGVIPSHKQSVPVFRLVVFSMAWYKWALIV